MKEKGHRHLMHRTQAIRLGSKKHTTFDLIIALLEALSLLGHETLECYSDILSAMQVEMHQESSSLSAQVAVKIKSLDGMTSRTRLESVEAIQV